MVFTTELLDRLVRFDTVSQRPNLDLIDFVQDYLAARGFALTRLDDPGGEKAGLLASIGPGNGGVLLSAHSDVVPVGGQDWTRPPFRLTSEGGRLYGRGTTDMKGFLAAMLSLADRAAGLTLGEPLKLVISYDEEVGCRGMAQMIGALGPALGRPRACIVGEPTGMRVATGHKGKRSLRAICRGQAGHSALAPRFANALHLAADFIGALRREQARLAEIGARDEDYEIPYSTLHAGRMSGGTALNMVPERAQIDFELRHLAADDPAAILEHLKEAASALDAGCPGGGIALEETSRYPGLDVPHGAEVTRMVQDLAGTGAPIKVGFGTEAGFLAGLGIPTVVCGPGSMEGQGHKPDEYIQAAQLAACDAMLDRLLGQMA